MNLYNYRWLAHDSVEEDLTAKYGLLPWALQTNDGHSSVDLKNDFNRFLSKKNDLWTRMGFRARVTKDECDEVKIISSFFSEEFILIIDNTYSIKPLDLAKRTIE
jgi:hypothetical protein